MILLKSGPELRSKDYHDEPYSHWGANSHAFSALFWSECSLPLSKNRHALPLYRHI